VSAPDISLPGTVHVVPPPSAVHVVPVAGPPGPPGADGSVVGGISAAAAQELIDDSITVHEIDPTPHPAYDDLPSLRLLFENGLI